MPYSDPIKRKEYEKTRQIKRKSFNLSLIKGNEIIKCKCGCGLKLWKLDYLGKERKYIIGHNMVGKKGENSTRWNGGEVISKGYKYVYKSEHPFCNKKGYVLEHRLVMEQKIGRYLTKQEVVHHLDHNTLNNDISNLELVNGSGHHLMEFHNVRDSKNGRFINEKIQ